MDNLKQRGRSRKKNQNRFLDRLIRGNRRKLSALLCASMVLNGTVTTFPVMAAEAEKDTVSRITLESSELWDALDDAVEKDSKAVPPEFSGEHKKAFEDIFDNNLDLYKLSSAGVTNINGLNVEIYAKVSPESLEAKDSYDEDSVEFVFLVSNGSETEEKSAQIVIDGKASKIINVAAVENVEDNGKGGAQPDVPAEPSTEAPAESVQNPADGAGEGQTGTGETPAEEIKPEESLPADSSEETAGSEEGTLPADETTEAPAEVPEQGEGETASDDETEAEVPETPAADDGSDESQAPEEVPGTGDPVEDGSDVQPGTGDEGSVMAPDSSDEGQQEDSQPAEDSAPAEDSQQSGDSSAEPAGDSTPAADDSQSGSAEASDNSGEGVTVAALSVSLHNAPYLAASGDPLATDAERDDQTETLSTDNAAEEDTLGGKWIEDAALMGGDAVVAYVVSGSVLSGDIVLEYDEVNKTVEISNAAELRQWAEDIHHSNSRCDGYTVNIVNDIDLSGENWTSIISLGGTVTIDGQGHTISNMTIEEQSNGSGGNTYLGFIGNLNYNTKLTVRDITFENAHVQDLGGDSQYSWCGVVVGHGPMDGVNESQAECTFTNVNVVNSVVTGGHNNGGIMGYSCSTERGIVFEGCSVTDSFIGGYNSTSGILFGMGIANVTVRDCQADGVMLYTDGLNFNCSQSYDEQLWLGNVYPYEICGDKYGSNGTANYVEDTNDWGSSQVVYPVYFHVGNQTIKKYVPVNTDLNTFDEEWFGDIFEVGSGRNIAWMDGTAADAAEVKQITADLTDNDMYPYGKQSLVNDESYETQDTDQVANPLTHGAIDLYAKDAPTDPVNPDVPEWKKSKSKTATNLDENYESRVTLSLPAAQETLETDVVFVVDKSTSAEVQDEAVNMLRSLQGQAEESGATVNVGVVIFNKEAHRYDWGNLTNEADFDRIASAIRNEDEIESGTNIHAGLLEGKKMLDEDTDVDANRKYLILISDGLTYIYDEDPTSILTIGYEMNASNIVPSPVYTMDAWGSKYGYNTDMEDVTGISDPVTAFHTFLYGTNGVEQRVLKDGDHYDLPYDSIEKIKNTPAENGIPALKLNNRKAPLSDEDYAAQHGNEDDQNTHANNVEKALYLTSEVFKEAQNEGYHCYAVKKNDSVNATYPWGVEFMDYLANGKEVSFDEIQNEIYYLLDAGSTVVDEIGYGEDYDFAFVKPEEMVLTVGGQEQERAKIDDNHWGFGKRLENGKYPYEVTYYADGSDEAAGEHFVWAINVPVTNFAPVELTYTVKLTNPHTEAGTYGRYDEDGSENYSGLYTNKDATLNPVDSNGYKGDSEKFQKPTVSYTVNGSSSTPAEWEISKSKTATELNENRESTVTLGLPSAQESLVSDVVFVLDRSTSTEVEQQILDMLSDLKTEIEEKQAKVNVGVVIFNQEAHIGCELTDLTTGYAEIEKAIKTEIKSGTNLHAGLLAGKAMLDEDTEVDANRKYLITISDGITYIYGETPTAVALQNGDKTNAFAGPDNWMTKYGTNDAPSQGWDNWIEQIAAQIQADGSQYEVSYGTNDPYIPYDERADHAMSIDRALYNSYLVYNEAKASGYHCYVDLASANASHPWAVSFMDFMADGRKVDFSVIKNDILYLLDAGSRVVDVIGEGTSNLGDPYDFTFVNDISRMNLTVDGVALDKKEIESVDGVSYSYGFGDRGDGTYRFVVTYYPNGTQDTDGEHFVWEIHEAISNFAPVQFQYVVRLTTAPTAGGTHGQYDGNGEHNYSGLLTNKEATLYPVDSNGTTYPSENFPKPTVSYTVDNGGDTPVDPTPGGSGGGGSSSGSGSSGGGAYTPSGGPGVTINPEEVPLAPLPDTSTTTTIGENEVPLSPLPKTGETARRGWAVMMLSGALMALAAVLSRKREEER